MLSLFFDRRFAHYTWIGVAVTLFNAAFLYAVIDGLGAPTVPSSLVASGLVFLLRYVLMTAFKVVG